MAYTYALKQFKDGIKVNNLDVKVNRTSRKEFTRSRDSFFLERNDKAAFADKMRSADIADDVITASTNWIRDGKLSHDRADNFVDFLHGDVLIASGANTYKARTVIGITNAGNYELYDVVGINPENFEIKKQDSLTTSDSKRTDRSIHGNPASDKISQSTNSVKRDSYSVDNTTDAEYLQAVMDGDTQTAQEMVREAAEAAGYTFKGYHGTPHGGFTVFDKARSGKRGSFESAKAGFYFSENEEYAKGFSHSGGSVYDIENGFPEAQVYTAYLKIKNPLEVVSTESTDEQEVLDWIWKAKANGNDGIVDMLGNMVVFEPEQIKSADAITYDDNGNVVPLSERFNPKNRDIRYSVDTETEQETVEEQTESAEGKKKSKKDKKPLPYKITASESKAQLRKDGQMIFSIPEGSRGEANKMLDAVAERYIRKNTFAGHIGTSMDEMMRTEDYQAADEETRAKMLKRLYDHAANLTKNELFGLELENTNKKNIELVEAGVPLAAAVAWDASVSDLKQNEKAEKLMQMNFTPEQKESIYRIKISDSKQTDEDIKQAKEAKISFDNFLKMKASLDGSAQTRYMEAVGAGIGEESAFEFASDWGNLPKNAKTREKWKACVSFSSDVEDQLTALSLVMSDSQMRNMETAVQLGMKPVVYVDFWEHIVPYDTNKNGSYTQAEITAALKTYKASNDDKAIIWQLATGSKKAYKNPFGTKMGAEAYKIKSRLDAAAKEKEDAEKKQKEMYGQDNEFAAEIMRQLLGG